MGRALGVLSGFVAVVALAQMMGQPVLRSAAGGQSELVIHKGGTKLYHRPSCPVVLDMSNVLALTRAQAEARGYKPHAECDAANPTPDLDSKGKPAAPEAVYLDGSRYYHRKTCSKLDGKAAASPDGKTEGVKSVSLEVAGKSHWPCPTCKPPIRKRSPGAAATGTGRPVS